MMDYSINYTSRMEAIGECIGWSGRKLDRMGVTRDTTVVRSENLKNGNFRAIGGVDKSRCMKKLTKSDCNQITCFMRGNKTKKVANISGLKYLWVEIDPDKNPSFSVESKPRIDNNR